MQLQIFKYQSEEEQMLNEIKTVDIDGEIWFVASDVARTLGYSNPRDAIARHCKPRGVVKHDILALANFHIEKDALIHGILFNVRAQCLQDTVGAADGMSIFEKKSYQIGSCNDSRKRRNDYH